MCTTGDQQAERGQAEDLDRAEAAVLLVGLDVGRRKAGRRWEPLRGGVVGPRRSRAAARRFASPCTAAVTCSTGEAARPPGAQGALGTSGSRRRESAAAEGLRCCPTTTYITS